MVISMRRAVLSGLLASTALILPAAAQAQDSSAPDLPPDQDEIVVTAQKRDENIQSVPISIQAIGTRKLDQLNISNFNEYTQLLPSVAFQTSQPGVTTVYMRGVASGGDGNHSGSLPSVGSYLDEQPVTTIGGTLDVHIYDIARIESLAGPQGTLYGASSQAGTIRIITNKPDAAGFDARIDAEVNTVAHGGQGGKVRCLDRCAGPNAKPGGGIAIGADIIGDAFFVQQRGNALGQCRLAVGVHRQHRFIDDFQTHAGG